MARHPKRQMRQRAIRLVDDQGNFITMPPAPRRHNRFATSGMKAVPDRHLFRLIVSIMSLLRRCPAPSSVGALYRSVWRARRSLGRARARRARDREAPQPDEPGMCAPIPVRPKPDLRSMQSSARYEPSLAARSGRTPHVAAQRVDDLRALAHEQIARAEDHRRSLLGLALDRHEPHGRSGGGFRDRLGVGRIVRRANDSSDHSLFRLTLPLYERLDVGR